jgi:putrescine aminotransferase
MRACWDTMVLAPPLVITKKEIDELVRRARLALDKTLAEVRSEMASN